MYELLRLFMTFIRVILNFSIILIDILFAEKLLPLLNVIYAVRSEYFA